MLKDNSAAKLYPTDEPAALKTGHKNIFLVPNNRVGTAPGILGASLKRAQSAISKSFQSMIASYQINPTQFSILMLTHGNKGLSQSELGNAMQIDRSTMVSIIDKMEKADLVVRAPSIYDRRSYALELSKKGSVLLTKMLPEVQKYEAEIASKLNSEEFEMLIGLLAKLS